MYFYCIVAWCNDCNEYTGVTKKTIRHVFIFLSTLHYTQSNRVYEATGARVNWALAKYTAKKNNTLSSQAKSVPPATSCIVTSSSTSIVSLDRHKAGVDWCINRVWGCTARDCCSTFASALFYMRFWAQFQQSHYLWYLIKILDSLLITILLMGLFLHIVRQTNRL